ncbi:adenylate/guanylate cyclase domain-containing protein [Nocardia sp. NPDC060256]|uniref:adenylate/guanylate cyclase domain-containing protein n=1 Tax=unclassified Nocardia TaxID=2637762 RepID=UPI00364AD758
MSEERRLVAVLFADVVGSTALADGMDPEDTRILMGRYFEHAVAVMDREEGRLEKFIGDAVVAVFGIPRAFGDESERAVAAALNLLEAVRSDELLGALFRLRLGINLGEVVTNPESRADHFLASGDTMNTAARLQQAAEPDEILVSERVFLAADEAFEFGPRREVQMKGKAAPVVACRVLGARTTRRVERPPLVGRRQELFRLRHAAERVVEHHRAELVTVLAPSGLGKTRLIEEFTANLPPQLGFEVVRVVVAQHAQASSEQVRSLIGGLLGADVDAARIRRVFVDAGHTIERADDYTREIMAAMGDGGRIGADGTAMAAALRVLIASAVPGRKVAVLIDNAHQASDLLLEVAAQAINQRFDLRLLVVIAARPELLDRRPDWGRRRDRHTLLSLPQLTDDQTRSIAARYLTGRPARLVDLIATRAGGNPFFILEFIRSATRGVVDATEAEPPLPDTVHAAVLARLDLLTACARDVLKLVTVADAVLPTDRYADLLAEWGRAEVDRGIHELLAKDIVRAEQSGRLMIGQPIVRDIVYGALPRAMRIELHSGVASLLAGLDRRARRLSVMIGKHYLSAIEASRRSTIPIRLPFESGTAVTDLMTAATVSSSAGLVVDAQTFLEGARSIAEPERLPELFELLGAVSGISPTAVTSYEQALRHLAEAGAGCGDSRAVAVRIRRKLLLLWLRCGLMARTRVDRDTILRHYVEAHRLAADGADRDETLRLRTVDLFLFFERQPVQVVDGEFVARTDPAALLAEGRAIVAHFLAIGDVVAANEALDGCHIAATHLHLPETALEFCRERLLLHDLPPHELGDALAMLARAHAALGNPAAGLAAIEQEANRHRDGDHAPYLAHPLAHGIAIAYAAGEWATAERLGARLARIYEQTTASPQDAALCVEGFFALVRIAVAREDRQGANGFARLILDCLRTLPTLLPAGRALLALELRDGADGAVDGAEFGSQALSFVSFNNERGLLSSPAAIAEAAANSAAYRSCVPEVARALRDGDDTALAACITALDDLGRLVTAARLRLVHAQRTGDRSHLPAARTTLERLRDRRFLRRLAALGDPSRA